MAGSLAVKIGGLKLKNPVMVASGTFGYGREFEDFMPLKKLGALVSKTITINPRRGNLAPRTCETPCGMLNSVGLENPGLEVFLKEKLPDLARSGVPVVVSIASEGGSDEFVRLAGLLDAAKGVAALELNISCPNIRHASPPASCARLVSQDPKATFEVVRAVRKVTKKTLITKLSPNVTDIVEIARAACDAGSDALALINTVAGMSIDVATRKPKIAMVTAGLSGPAIRPIALRMVWEVSRKINIPIIGMGGIIDASSALEFIIAGATAISVGTANFVNPGVTVEIIEGIKAYLAKHSIKDIKSLVGSLIL